MLMHLWNVFGSKVGSKCMASVGDDDGSSIGITVDVANNHESWDGLEVE